MLLITKAMNRKLRANHDASLEDTQDHTPVLKLFTPWGNCTWLISERDSENPDLLFGLCDLGMQCPELGYVSLAELISVKGPFGLRIERDRHFDGKKPLGWYADEARRVGHIAA